MTRGTARWRADPSFLEVKAPSTTDHGPLAPLFEPEPFLAGPTLQHAADLRVRRGVAPASDLADRPGRRVHLDRGDAIASLVVLEPQRPDRGLPAGARGDVARHAMSHRL